MDFDDKPIAGGTSKEIDFTDAYPPGTMIQTYLIAL